MAHFAHNNRNPFLLTIRASHGDIHYSDKRIIVWCLDQAKLHLDLLLSESSITEEENEAIWASMGEAELLVTTDAVCEAARRIKLPPTFSSSLRFELFTKSRHRIPYGYILDTSEGALWHETIATLEEGIEACVDMTDHAGAEPFQAISVFKAMLEAGLVWDKKTFLERFSDLPRKTRDRMRSEAKVSVKKGPRAHDFPRPLLGLINKD